MDLPIDSVLKVLIHVLSWKFPISDINGHKQCLRYILESPLNGRQVFNG